MIVLSGLRETALSGTLKFQISSDPDFDISQVEILPCRAWRMGMTAQGADCTGRGGTEQGK
jgi:hypothetical protein